MLSDLFSRAEENPELELRVTVININPGYSENFLKRCESLKGYMVFVEKVREKRKAGIKLESAILQALEECISENILAEFFRENREEVVEMSIGEFDQELHDKTFLGDGEAIGLEKDIEKGTLKAIEN